MAHILSDGTEGSFLRKTNELLEINGFRKMPFTEAQLSNTAHVRKDPNIEFKLPEKGKTEKKTKRNTGKAPPSDGNDEESSEAEEVVEVKDGKTIAESRKKQESKVRSKKPEQEREPQMR